MVVQDFGQVEQPNVRHWLLRFRSSHGLILATVCVAIFNVSANRASTLSFSKTLTASDQDVFLFGTVGLHLRTSGMGTAS